MTSKKPQIITVNGLQRCSLCLMPIEPKDGEAPEAALRKHVEEMHQKRKTREDVNQAAARVFIFRTLESSLLGISRNPYLPCQATFSG